MKSPREARRGPDGEIWVADYHDEEVARLPVHVHLVGSSGTAWVTTANKVIGDGNQAGHGNGEVNSPYNIAFSPDGKTGYVRRHRQRAHRRLQHHELHRHAQRPDE